MIRVMFLIAAPILLLALCGVAGAETGDSSVRMLFAREPVNGGASPVAQPVAMVRTMDGSDTSPSERSMEVTSDSRDYCSRLMRTIDEHDRQIRSEDVVALRKEGQRLCSQGYVRLGVTRLREALAILKGRNIHP